MLTIGIIGAGRIGKVHLESISYHVKNATVKAVADPFMNDETKAFIESFGVKDIYTDYKKILEDKDIDAVLVCSSTDTHASISIEAIEAGKHVFCEKPMAESARECDEMIEACRKAGVKLQIGFMRRFDRNFRRGKALIDAGAVGKVTSLRSNTHGPSEPQPWMFDVRTSYGPIGEVNSHDFDTLRWYAGSEVKRLYAVGHNFRSPEMAAQYPEYYDTCQTLLEFENGVIGTISGAQYVRYGYDSRAEILGTEGIIKVGTQHDNAVELTVADKRNIVDSVASWRDLFAAAYTAEDQAFADCVLNDTEPEVTGHDGKMALLLVNAGLRSILEKRPVEIAEVE